MARVDGVTGPELRWATREDADAVAAIDRATHSTLVSPGPGLQRDGDPFARHEPEDTLVAVLDGRVVGYAILGPATPLDSNAHVQMLHGLGVDPAVGRRGVGRALVRGAVEQARTRGATRLRLRVLGHNDGARRLYEAEGFEVEGVLRGEFVLDGHPVDDVLMARGLD